MKAFLPILLLYVLLISPLVAMAEPPMPDLPCKDKMEEARTNSKFNEFMKTKGRKLDPKNICEEVERFIKQEKETKCGCKINDASSPLQENQVKNMKDILEATEKVEKRPPRGKASDDDEKPKFSRDRDLPDKDNLEIIFVNSSNTRSYNLGTNFNRGNLNGFSSFSNLPFYLGVFGGALSSFGTYYNLRNQFSIYGGYGAYSNSPFTNTSPFQNNNYFNSPFTTSATVSPFGYNYNTMSFSPR